MTFNLIVLLAALGFTPLGDPGGAVCRVEGPPAYYTIELVPTRRIPTASRARGKGEVTFAASPFGVALSADGAYVYDLQISIDRLPPPKTGVYVAWVSTHDLKEFRRLGPLDAGHRIGGRVAWNKFLVIITLEAADGGREDGWDGPVVLRGISRSGLMHTMAGHGPFRGEPCARFGY